MHSPSTVPALFVQVMVWSATKPETPGAAIKERAIQPTPWCSKGNHRMARTATTFVELPKLARNLSSNLEGWKAGWRKKTGGGIKTTDWYTQDTIKIFLSRDAPQPLQPMGKWSAPLVLGPMCFPKRSKKDIIGFEDPTDGLPYQNRRSKPKLCLYRSRRAKKCKALTQRSPETIRILGSVHLWSTYYSMLYMLNRLNPSLKSEKSSFPFPSLWHPMTLWMTRPSPPAIEGWLLASWPIDGSTLTSILGCMTIIKILPDNVWQCKMFEICPHMFEHDQVWKFFGTPILRLTHRALNGYLHSVVSADPKVEGDGGSGLQLLQSWSITGKSLRSGWRQLTVTVADLEMARHNGPTRKRQRD